MSLYAVLRLFYTYKPNLMPGTKALGKVPAPFRMSTIHLTAIAVWTPLGDMSPQR
jgi:hypothetical protein